MAYLDDKGKIRTLKHPIPGATYNEADRWKHAEKASKKSAIISGVFEALFWSILTVALAKWQISCGGETITKIMALAIFIFSFVIFTVVCVEINMRRRKLWNVHFEDKEE